ncbi:MAG TPA: tetratricopeptide repeat protein [Terracidiphilus sp.]|nr:tetratricopeptide repeat protein [Terracidiphilus sp.]
MKKSGLITALVVIAALCGAAFAPVITVRATQGTQAKPAESTSAPVTWSHDIAPLVYQHCTTCHHPGGAGPFSLLTYNDARRWGPQVVTVTQSRFMPPWLPEPGYGDFADVRRLSNHERALIQQWAELGAPEGDPKEAPAPPHYDATWTLGKPDLILKVPRPYTLNAGGTDVFRNFILPYPLKQTHYIRAMEIVPGAPQIVHHANVIIDRTASYRREHPDDWQDGIPGMELLVDSGNRFDPDSHFLFWKPDTPAIVESPGMPWRLDPGNDLILNMHLKPSGKPETLDAQVGLYFTDQPPAKFPMLLQLDRDDALNIPAGDAHFVVEGSLKLPVDVDVLGVYPHAHYLGRDLEGWAMLPDGKKKWLVWIRNWDIDRQSVYRYKEPLFLPKGSVLHMRYTYDNSAGNVHNPNSPPIRVQAGNRSVDEMSHLWVQVLPVNVAPNAPDPRLLLEEAWMRNRLSKSPDDKVGLYNLASALAGEGKFGEAVTIYEQDLKHDPKDSRTLTALGAALEGAGDWKAAETRLRSAIDAHPDACDARFDVANVELRHEELNSAEADFRAQLAQCPEDAEVHAGLGSTLAKEGQNDAAMAEFQRSLILDQNDEAALLGEGELQAGAGQTEQAIATLSKAVSTDSTSTDALEQLARAYAQSGQLGKALDRLRAAVRLKPDDPLLHSAISQVLAASGNLDDAITEQQAALKLLEDDPDGWNNLGVLEARTGKTASAREDFEHALKLQPDHAEAKANLARLQGHD